MDTITSNQIPWGPIGEEVYKRSYSRRMPDGRQETWPDTVARVVRGTAERVSVAPRESELLRASMESFKVLPAGRHLWITGTGQPYTRNCWRAPWSERLADHFEFSAIQLLTGGGVGANYSTEYLRLGPTINSFELRITCSEQHPDYKQTREAAGDHWVDQSDTSTRWVVPDTREAWAETWGALFEIATWGDQSSVFTIDVSDLRPFGAQVKTFGGTASGPTPFVRACVGIYEVLSGATGRHLTPLEAMEADHQIAAAVVSGGVRRSARMSILHWKDPHVFEFIKCKADHQHHWSTNISVEVDDEFFESLDAGDKWANTVMNQVIAGMYHNGEPGFYNVALASVGERGDVRSTNPCFSGDSWVRTTEGLRQVRDLVNRPTKIVLHDSVYGTSGFFPTGVKPTITVNIDGSSLCVTPDHKLHTPVGWVAAKDLNVGDSVSLSKTTQVWDGPGDKDSGYLLGMLVGDGTFLPNGTPRLDVWYDDAGDDFGLRDAVSEAITRLNLSARSNFKGFRNVEAANKWSLSMVALRDLANSFGIFRGNKTVTPEVMRGSYEFTVGFLRGLFDADGHVEGSSTAGGVSIRLTQSDPTMLSNVRLMLLALGVPSRVYGPDKRQHGRRTLPGQLADSQPSYRLTITGHSAVKFMSVVGFAHRGKAAKASERLTGMSRGAYQKPLTGRVRSIEMSDTQMVYDIQVPGVNALTVSGVVAHNCGEVILEEGESCNIGSVNLAAFGTDDEGAVEAFRLMTRFLIRATMNPPVEELSAQVEARNRRIGVGFLGFQEWAAAHGVKYSQIPESPELAEKLNMFRRVVRHEADTYSAELGVPAPIKVTAIAPNGSIAQMPGVKPGIHAAMARYFLRRVQYTWGDPGILDAYERGLNVEDSIYAANTAVVAFPVRDSILDAYPEELVEQVDEVSLHDQLAVLAFVTEHFCGGEDGNGVSFTANFNPTETDEQSLYQAVRTWLPKVKGLTAFPEVSRPQTPYEPISRSDFESLTAGARWEDLRGDSNDGQCRGAACPIK